MSKFILIVSIILVQIYTLNAQISWTKGDGSKNNPYQIESISHLQFLAEKVNSGESYENTYFILVNDLDLSAVCGYIGSDTISWMPIGDEKHPFKGNFNGGNHQIKNLFIQKPHYEITTSNEIPYMLFMSSFKDTIYDIGPFTINAKILSRSSSAINTPMFYYVSSSNNSYVRDSVLMTNIDGDSIWTVQIPSMNYYTNLNYFVIASDKVGNINVLQSEFYIDKTLTNDSNSVVLCSIDKPDSLMIFNSNSSVRITIQNVGIKNLNSLDIGWSINNVLQPPFSWNGNVFPGYKEQINLGHYRFGSINTTDTLKVWIYNPNGGVDNNLENDSMVILVKNTCSGLTKGVYIIGNSENANFQTVNQAITILKNANCIDKNIVFKLENGTYIENIDLTDIADVFQNYSLTITSLSGEKDSVILSVASGVLFTLSNTNNLNIYSVTMDVSLNGTYGVYFNGPANKICIKNCNIYANSTAKSNLYAGIYSSELHSWNLNNVSIINNTLKGGYSNIYFLAGNGNNYGNENRIDSNICKNAYFVGIHIGRAQLSSVSHNTVITRNSNTSQDIYGIYLKNAQINSILSNKVTINSAPNRLYSIYLNQINNTNPNSFIFANNEISVLSNGQLSYGLYLTDVKGNIYNNSIYLSVNNYMSGSCISFNNSTVNLKNNIIICSPTQVIFEGFPTTSDYNNLYGGDFMLLNWQQTTSNDSHSVSQMPYFIDINNSLELTDYSNYTCPRLNSVLTDIVGEYRTQTTTMGAYSVSFYIKENENRNIIKKQKKNVVNDVDDSEIESISLVEKSLIFLNDNFHNISKDSIFHGLFGYIEKASIDSLHLSNTDIDGIYFVGPVVGFADSSNITACSNSGNIKGDYYIGGLIGRAKDSKISSCVNSTIIKGLAAGGGICGDARYNSEISNCINSGLILCSSANVGGIVGILDSSSIKYSLNYAQIKGSLNSGAIVGKLNQSKISNCFYDKQLSLKKAIGSDVSSLGIDSDLNLVIGLATKKMLGDSLNNYLNTSGNQSWKFTNNLYPRPLGVENSDVAIIASLPVLLSNNEHADSVFTDFIFIKGTNTIQSTWFVSDTNKLKIIDSSVIIPCFMRNDTVCLLAAYKSATKKILLKVTNPIEIPLKPDNIYGPTQISSVGKYTYYVNKVIGATTYQWDISDTNCVGSSNTDTIVLTIKDSGSIVLTVKAINNCGESEKTELTIQSVIEPVVPVVNRLVLGQNYPNPANTYTNIPISIPRDGNVKFKITNMYGQEIYKKIYTFKKGNHIIKIDTQNLENSVYSYTIEYNKTTLSKKMCVFR